jgi:hypothetical protein
MRAGSLQNLIADRASNGNDAKVGNGATVIFWTDRKAATIIEVSKTGHRVTVQADKAIRTDDHGMSDAQSYRFERDENGATYEATRRKDGSYRLKGGDSRVLLGVRDHYHDYSF